MKPLFPRAGLVPALLLLHPGPSAGADTETDTWEVESQGIQARLTQITPDQARAFYQARGFTAEQTERYVSRCVFMTVVRNVGTSPIHHDLAAWRYLTADGQTLSIPSKADWAAQWESLGVDNAARIAFTWAQFPGEQTFEPGDWNQGMTTYAVPRGGSFDLLVRWRDGTGEHTATLNHLKCANETP